MTEESNTILRATKCANIIKSICELFGVSLQKATDMFYTSAIAGMIEDKIADLHCRSDKYLATLIWEEQQENAVP
ncbi:MAG: DUF3791 domain-containing protein [Paramuribaculum sp.]|nr:DUF3791 domain-containing protein [Paramuribaculum sp.]